MILFLKLANFRRERQSQLTIATATVFFHRFYVVPANRDIDKYVVATACLFLAGKVEETPKRLTNVLLCAHQTRAKYVASTSDLKVRLGGWLFFFGKRKKTFVFLKKTSIIIIYSF